MKIQKASRQAIDNFLAQKRFALVGISRSPREFSMALFDELCRRGYDVVPVTPHMPQVKGRRCFARVQDIQPPVEGALLMTSPKVTDEVVRDCADAGVKRIWMYSAGGKGAVSDGAVSYCLGKGMELVPGECPFMFLPKAGAIHGLHGFVRKITGTYPRH